jgi:hypothetical protein
VRKLLVATGLATAMVLASASSAAAQTDESAENCGGVIMTQSDAGIEAGGGPKEGILAPTNCDHFFQAIGAIGNGYPRGLEGGEE